MRLYYDLHIHSCLSPCGDDEMTPNNIVNMAFIKELDVIAVTDHNTGGNVEAVMTCADRIGLMVIPGMELQTKEEIHVLCYFGRLGDLKAFESELEPYRMPIPNKVERFGHQWLMDSEDNVIKEYPNALILSLNIGLDDVDEMVERHSGIMIPAHINKGANGLIKYLGFVPDNLVGRTMEVSNKVSVDPKWVENSRVIYNSDAHFITDINEKEHFMNVESATVDAVIDYLKGRKIL